MIKYKKLTIQITFSYEFLIIVSRLMFYFNIGLYTLFDRLCGLVLSIEDYKYRGLGFDFSEGVGSGTGSTQPRDRIS
jgi:hypothetical protein